MNYVDALEYIHSLGMFSHEASLDRITALCEKLHNPQNNFKSIHIAGTNGKGSVATYLAEIFKRAGYKTGLYTSPYIIRFNERISINGEHISDDELAFLCEKVQETTVECTEFEFITAIAFEYFSRQKCDIVIAETGLGGRFDATNVLSNKCASVITKIGLDHCAVLGDTIEQIAAEKCGIIKCEPLITSHNQSKAALDVIESYKNDAIVPKPEELQIKNSDFSGNTFIYKGKEYQTSLIGEHQIENALCAIETVENSGYDIPYNIIYEGIKNAFIPARLETLNYEGKQIIIDGAHNPDAANRLYDFLSSQNKSICAIVGMMADKDYKYVLERILPLCNNSIAVKCANVGRALGEEELCNMANQYCLCESAKSFNEALNKAVKTNADIIVAFGSLYLAAGLREIIKEK